MMRIVMMAEDHGAVTTPSAGDPLDDEEIRQLVSLLARYATHELDQFDHWRVETPHGPVFVDVSRYPRPGAPESAYQAVTMEARGHKQTYWVVGPD